MKNENESPWMTASQYARHRSVSRQYVARMVKAGLLPMKGRLIDAVEADRLLDDRPDAGPTATGDNASRYAEAKTIRTIFQAKLARLEFETRQGKLIERDAVKERVAGHISAIRDGLEGLAERLAGPIAAQGDPRKVRALMKAEITRELVRIAGVIGGRQEEKEDASMRDRE